jgi:hypothetical protein
MEKLVIKPQKSNLYDYNLFTEHEKNDLSRTYNNVINQIIHKNQIIEMIKHENNLSSPELDRNSYPIFKYLPDKLAD